MDQTDVDSVARLPAFSVTRRAAMRGVAGVGLATALGPISSFDQDPTAVQRDAATPVATPVPPATLSEATLRAFEADVEAALQTFRVPGAAVALVQGNEIVYNRGFGLRDVERGEPVTPRTRFRIGSITKSMTSLLLATLVDEGVFGWEDRVVGLSPEFEAPTPELTRTLRVRDLLGMGSGIAESETVSLAVIEFFMMAGLISAGDVLRSVSDLPLIAPLDTTFAYNNTLYAAAAYMGLLAAGTPPEALEAAYATEVRRRIFEPIGMTDAAMLDDPRPLGHDYAVGYTQDIFGEPSPLSFVSLAGLAPAGSGLASSTDMARYLITQMNAGVAPDGSRVASAANLAETHRPGVLVEPGQLYPPEIQPDTVSLRYAQGWFSETFRDGRQLLWHGGGIEGFDALTGFDRDAKIGFVILNNSDRGGLFYLSVRASFLNRLFGLNRDLPDFLASVVPVLDAPIAELAAQTRPVDPAAAAPYQGLYEDGFRVRLDDAGALSLDHDIRSMPLRALSDGSYVVSAGPEVMLGQSVSFDADANGVPVMTITGFSPVRWLTGG